jgi:hypothetical protein
VTRRWDFGRNPCGEPCSPDPRLSRLTVLGERLKANGSYVFLIGGTEHSSGGRYRYEIHRADSRGRARLESSAALNPDSFHATRRTIIWTTDAAERRASFR